MRKKILLLSLLACIGRISAQDGAEDDTKEKLAELKGKVTGLEESYLETKGSVDKLSKIKVSGYIQAQYRMVMDTASSMDNTGKYLVPIGDFSGGKFADGTQSVLQVRRGRLKIGYDNGLAQSAVQLDATEKGVGIKDAWLAFKDPWAKSLALKAGLFDRPFGFEISYSSSMRESPERSRLFQTLFPGERDVGAQLEVVPAEKYGALSMLNLKAGLFNGAGIAVENDDNKDFIGRLGASIPLTDINLAIDLGISAYMGKVTNTDTTHARVLKNSAGTADSIVYTRGFFYEVDDKTFKKSDSSGMLNKSYDRQYMGADLQLYYDIPVIGGLSLRGELINGKQPGTSSANGAYSAVRNSTRGVYMRNFMGYYVMYVQNIFLKDQLVVKYDVYDPNTDVKGTDIKNVAVTNLSSADLQYTTIGLGLVHHWDENVKIVLYYEMIENEKAALDINNADDKKVAVWNTDVKDDVLSVRVQYKF